MNSKWRCELKVLMVVNNPGSNDLRVVKEAEYILSKGYECIVLGIQKPGMCAIEKINGVVYLRRPARYDFGSCLLSVFPKLVSCGVAGWKAVPENGCDIWRYIYDQAKEEEDVNATNRAGEEPKSGASNNEVRKKHTLGDGVRYIRRKLLRVVNKLGVFHSLALRLRQGAYLAAFYPVVNKLNPDIVQSHELACLESCVLGSRNKAPVVYDSHELETHRNVPWPQLSKTMMSAYEKKYIKHVEAVVAVSYGCAAYLRQEYDIDNVLVVRNMPMAAMQRQSDSDLRKDLSLSNDVPLLVYTGSVTINRGIESIINALSRMPGYHFACVGPLSDLVYEKLLTLSSALNVDDRVHFISARPPSELISYVSSGDIAVIPIQNVCLSYYYCLPNKIFEAMHAGLPIVASNLPDMRSLVRQEELGVVCDMESVDEISKNISQVYSGKESWSDDSRLCELKSKYKFEADMDALFKIYERLAL